jgi:DNA-binding transcriptional MerR regulator
MKRQHPPVKYHKQIDLTLDLTLESVPPFTIFGVTGMSSEKRFYRSGELAELAGVSSDTLRHYERKGVLARPLRKANDYRQYPVSALQRVRLIRRAIAVGFTLDELASVFSVRDRGGAPCMEVRALAAAKLSDIETRLREMSELRNELRAVLKDWDKRLEHRVPGQRAHLLESLNAGRNGELGNRRRGSVNRSKKKVVS